MNFSITRTEYTKPRKRICYTCIECKRIYMCTAQIRFLPFSSNQHEKTTTANHLEPKNEQRAKTRQQRQIQGRRARLADSGRKSRKPTSIEKPEFSHATSPAPEKSRRHFLLHFSCSARVRPHPPES